MPAMKPTAAGTMLDCAISMLGSSSDHTLAATITPLAKPSRVFCSRSGISLRMKKTKADPSIVPAKGSSIPIITAFMTLSFQGAKIQILCHTAPNQ